MIIKLIIGIAIIAALFSFIHKYKKAKPEERKSWILKGVIAVVVVAVIVGAITGRVPVIAGLVAAVATFGRFGLRWGMPLAKMWLAKSGGNATFRSEYLIMSVSVANGQMTGKVIKGEFAEQNLGNIKEDDIQKLHRFFNEHDKKSYYLLTAYIRSRGFANTFTDKNQEHFDSAQHDHHHSNHSNPPSQSSSVPLSEAMEIFGFKETPTKKEIITVHRRLMSKLHPDKGGSDYLAARVNQAREVLLAHHAHNE
ncbi:hypothetical protein [Marinagarivorans algicola]|uniref:hypothetical protein n=1 Tax=Marinagarivorans algicola TaxID=1513270 RepID=UPI0006BA0026|nr:hypothetical protein [Marinagarivorans algicola]